jgi:hypothetical protein
MSPHGTDGPSPIQKAAAGLLRAIILFKLEQLSILTVCFSGTTASVSYQRASLREKHRLRLNLAAVSTKLLCRSAWLRIFVV